MKASRSYQTCLSYFERHFINESKQESQNLSDPTLKGIVIHKSNQELQNLSDPTLKDSVIQGRKQKLKKLFSFFNKMAVKSAIDIFLNNPCFCICCLSDTSYKAANIKLDMNLCKAFRLNSAKALKSLQT